MKELADKGMPVSEEELAEGVKHAKLKVQVCTWAEMTITVGSGVAELEATDSGYTLRVSSKAISSEERSRNLGKFLSEVGLLYAAISEVAKSKGILDYVIKPGQGTGICFPADEIALKHHPIDSLASSLEGLATILLARRAGN